MKHDNKSDEMKPIHHHIHGKNRVNQLGSTFRAYQNVAQHRIKLYVNLIQTETEAISWMERVNPAD